MSASKDGNNILIEGTGNTLASVTSDIADTAFIENVSGSVYQINATTTRWLIIATGGELTIGNPEKFSTSETLKYVTTANNNCRFEVRNGGQFNMYGDVVLDLCETGAYYAYQSYIYGGFHIEGDHRYRPIIQNQHWLGFMCNGSADDDIYMDHCIVGSTSYPSSWDAFGIKLMGYQQYTRSNIHLEYIEFNQSYGQGHNMAAINFEYGGRGTERYIFNHCIFDTLSVGFESECGAGSVMNSTFRDVSSWCFMNSRGAPNFGDQQYYHYGTSPAKLYGQTYNVCSGNTFENSGAGKKIDTYYGATLLLTDCDFQETGTNTIVIPHQGSVLLYSGNTFAASDYLNLYRSGNLKIVNRFKWTVEDESSNPLSGATIFVRQNEDKERFLFETGIDGKPYTVLDDGAVYLSYIFQRAGNTTGDTWAQEIISSSGNSTYHTVVFSKEGYRSVTKTYEVEEDGDTEETIEMRALGAYSSVC